VQFASSEHALHELPELAGQLVHDVRPAFSYVAAGHTVHVPAIRGQPGSHVQFASDVHARQAPPELAGHGLHVAEPASSYVAAGHTVHVPAIRGQPGSHVQSASAVHAVHALPEFAGQAVHVAEPVAFAYIRGPHGVQAASAFVFLYVPSAHAAQPLSTGDGSPLVHQDADSGTRFGPTCSTEKNRRIIPPGLDVYILVISKGGVVSMDLCPVLTQELSAQVVHT